MSRLAIRLLGPTEITLDGKPLAQFETEKERALLLYLSAEAGQTHSRDVLAEILWPDRPEGAARANLRHAIYNLRSVLGDRCAGNGGAKAMPFLLVERNSIRLNESADLWFDSRRFLQLVVDNRALELAPINCLQEAVELYRGPFLDGVLIGDSAAFQEWILIKREQYEQLALRALSRLALYNEIRGDVEQAINFARRRIALAPWDEKAQVQILRLLAHSGRRAEALALFEKYKRKLAQELEVEPGGELLRIVQQIRSNALEMPYAATTVARRGQQDLSSPGFLHPGIEQHRRPAFVLREQELAKLNGLLQRTLQGQSGLAFVTGGPGLGKSALLKEFSRRAMEAHPHLLVAGASCSAFDDIGDSYLPFRDLMAMLGGNVESLWKAGTISGQNARRLWQARHVTVEAIVEKGSSLIDTIVDGDDLLAYAVQALPGDAEMLRQLAQLIQRERSGGEMLAQIGFFEQFTDVLKSLARRYPLLLLIDDLQWLDRASTGLLFHLGRRLADSRVFIVCAYRPEEVAFRSARHPDSLATVLNEFKRRRGDVWINLALADPVENRRFVDAYLDTEPNQLDEGFRTSLLNLTRGHPLFTAEVVRSMQERGDLVHADKGWLEAPKLEWETIPARIEAVIEGRINRLDPDLQQIMTLASIEGEVFTVQVLAHLLKQPERIVLEQLASQLEKRYRLVSAYKVINTGPESIVLYAFHHAIIRNYLYQSLGEAEKALLHQEVAAALEHLYGQADDQIVVQIAQHLSKAGEHARALPYIIRAAQLARRRYTYEEAVDLYSQSIELSERISVDNVSLARLYLERGLVLQTVGEFEKARADLEKAVQISRLAADRQGEWRALLESGRLWTSRDYQQASAFFDHSLSLARQLDDPLVLAGSLNWIGNWYLNAENPPEAIAHHLEALEIYEQHGTPNDLANTLDLLGIASEIGVDPVASVAYYDRAIKLFRELDDRPRLASSLIGKATLGTANVVTQCNIPVIKPQEARLDLEEAFRIAREINAPTEIAWALWSLSNLNTVEGNFEKALEIAENAVTLTSEIGHLEWLAGSKVALSSAYYELFALDEAEHSLLEALMLAKELQSRHWINITTDRLAALHLSTGDSCRAQEVLSQVVGPRTPMDSLGKRQCWVRQAEVQLQKGDPTGALGIIERLIASFPGKRADTVIPGIWLIRAEALAALGDLDKSSLLLNAAIGSALEMGTQFILWRLHGALGSVKLAMGHMDEVDAEYAKARALIEELSKRINNEDLRVNFLQNAFRTVEMTRSKGDGAF